MSGLLIVAGALLMTVVPYLLGCSNGAILVSKYILRDDIRGHGSGNAGLTNFNRVFGGKLTLLVIAADVLKAVFAVLLGVLGAHLIAQAGCSFFSAPRDKYIAGLFCVLGHMFPCMFGFHGGKGILSGGVVAIMIDWRIALIVWGSFLLLAVLTRYVSLGSICAGIEYPILAWAFFRDPICLIAALLVGGLIVFQHRGNISRLLHGTESKFTLHKKE